MLVSSLILQPVETPLPCPGSTATGVPTTFISGRPRTLLPLKWPDMPYDLAVSKVPSIPGSHHARNSPVASPLYHAPNKSTFTLKRPPTFNLVIHAGGNLTFGITLTTPLNFKYAPLNFNGRLVSISTIVLVFQTCHILYSILDSRVAIQPWTGLVHLRLKDHSPRLRQLWNSTLAGFLALQWPHNDLPCSESCSWLNWTPAPVAPPAKDNLLLMLRQQLAVNDLHVRLVVVATRQLPRYPDSGYPNVTLQLTASGRATESPNLMFSASVGPTMQQ
ncbi:hypothetical protein PCANC_13144 [Puccinia coronata f. sp. avenae]|uniref:Uncharacterized protein n=1 Tax=Puccinia coronata f. sp. avenae TaxID=200324 RepID=A0A2N5UWB6_9BASI|nr:hypothetical protein PCASD_13991 [Puccinia coronata f. sp. avenae]PLW42048.1 hypothetical protein PCANC_13144 [Puccinia coronata f. sp. avenae]